MKSGAYISLARTYSFVLLLVLYFGLDGTRSYVKRVGLLADARSAFATKLVSQPDETRGDFDYGSYTKEIPEVGRVTVSWTVEGKTGGGGHPGPLRLQQFAPRNEPQGKTNWTVNVVRHDGQRWQASVTDKQVVEAVKEAQQLPQPNSTNVVEGPFFKLTSIHQKIWRKAPEQKKPGDWSWKVAAEWFGNIEYDLVEQSVPIPGLELKFRSDLAPWIFTFATLGLLIQIRNQARRVLLDDELAFDEPWLILDGSVGLERALATAWLLAIGLAPWLANACLMVVLSGRVISGASLAGGSGVWVLFLLSLVLVLIGAWTSLTVLAELLRVRRLRLTRLAALKEEITVRQANAT